MIKGIYQLAGMSLLLSVGLMGCEPPDTNSTAGEAPKVVTTTTMITDWTDNIAGDTIEVIGLLDAGDDPHIYEPVPQDSQNIEEADLILYNGHDLEPELIRLIEGAGENTRQFAVGELISPLDESAMEEGETEFVPDPHVWGDVENVIVMVEAIAEELAAVSPENEEVYQENLEEYTAELEELHDWIGEQIETIPSENRKLVTTHDAFQYYTEAYGLEVVGTLIGISTEEQPSAQTVGRLASTVRETGVTTIFAEALINPRLIETVAEEAGVELAEEELYGDAIGAPGSDGDTYIKMMEANTRTIVTNLGGINSK
ncbi:metal ABC transporter substrate-binding protein [Euhalothece natronophila Z-M001]|uniref:Metal ABC transporter substrate-binding protein n=1 Tax=Euhalothece natronophila Z-M001 TaxID=522448 RepID=A0A5B8NLU2_9CHRO|nr:zinc ABC transporter substrate-binding protein [Euhalothece natronophila]QDZ39968.1 metal ABC transporter substrate-binding protein [Euhalothece natronophila Z-M001]